MSRNSSANNNRFWTIDAIRGVLILLLLALHIILALNDHVTLPLRLFLLDWQSTLQIIGVAIFLLTVGVTLSLTYRINTTVPRKTLVDGAGLLFIGFFVTIATFINDPRTLIAFGLITLVGAATILASVVVARPLMSLIAGIVLLIEGMLLSISPTLPSILGWIGPSPFLRTSTDYYPLIPWTALVLIGIYLGYRAYPAPEKALRQKGPAALTWLGRHVLVIYLLHQPLIVGTLLLLNLA